MKLLHFKLRCVIYDRLLFWHWTENSVTNWTALIEIPNFCFLWLITLYMLPNSRLWDGFPSESHFKSRHPSKSNHLFYKTSNYFPRKGNSRGSSAFAITGSHRIYFLTEVKVGITDGDPSTPRAVPNVCAIEQAKIALKISLL